MKKQAKRQTATKKTKSVNVIKEKENLTKKFLDNLNSFPHHLMETLLRTLGEETVLSNLEAARNIVIKVPGSKTIVSEGLVMFLKAVLDRSEYGPQVLACTCDIMKICSLQHLARMREFGVEKSLIETLKANSEVAKATCLLAEFLPALPHSKRNEYLEQTFKGIMFSGKKATVDAEHDRGLLMSLKAVYRPLVDICLNGDCSLGCGTLLTKVVYWAVRADQFELADQLRLIEVLSKDDDWQKNVFGMWIAFELTKELLPNKAHGERVRDSLRAARNRMHLLAMINFQNVQWITSLYALFDPDNPLKDDRAVVESLLEESRSDDRNFFQKKETVRSMVEFLTPFYSFDLGELIDFHYKRMTTFLEVVLNLPKDARRGKEKPKVDQKGIVTFGQLVSFVVEVINGYLLYDDYKKGILSVFTYEWSLAGVPSSPEEIHLKLSRSEALDKFICYDNYLTEEERQNAHIQALRLISVLYSVNENWGVLFCILPTGILVDRELFVSAALDEKISTYLERSTSIGLHTLAQAQDYGVQQYPFLLKFGTRVTLFDRIRTYFVYNRQEMYDDSSLELTVPRKNLVEHVAKNLDHFAEVNRAWEFRFQGELGAGRGPTKEFYTLFSTDCQRFELGLWIGERVPASDGRAEYVHNPAGLFPLPLALTSKESASAMKAISNVVFNSFSHGARMDLNLSPAFYKALLGKHQSQLLSIADVKNVVPSLAGYLDDLVEALRQKWSVEEDDSLTTKQKEVAASSITCDGCQFEDLCVDFTLPGYSGVEMKQGGQNVTLDVGNLEEYLKLLVWTLVYEGVQPCAGAFMNDLFETYKLLFLPYEFDRVLCGEKTTQWSVEELEQNCQLEEGYTVDMPVIRHLFEVLASLTAAEQSLFLQFVTGAPRLPVGGLGSLKPKLTIKRSGSSQDPDNVLPWSTTCFNTMFMAEYSSKEILRSKLLLAITEGANSFGFI